VSEAEKVLRTVNDWLAHGRRVCLATVVKRQGSAPREVGAKMGIADSGETVGSVGGGGLEQMIIARARQALDDGKPAVVDYDLSGEGASADALCGGKVSVLIEPLGETRRLVVVGAGHVGRAVARLAHWVGFAVTVVDDRQDLLSAEALGRGVTGVCASPEAVADLGLRAADFVVVCTRGHLLDKEWLRAVAGFAPRYVGMLGSREKARRVAEDLAAEGIAPDFVAGVHSPVGLAIEAETPEEIAVSVVGEIVLEWRKGKRGDG
jgi:xanthine dehydrogenase accessory factor